MREHFDLATSLNIPEAVHALQATVSAVQDMCRHRSFFLPRDGRRSLALPEFQDHQERHMDDEVVALRKWPHDVTDLIRSALKPVTKGWFNVNETRIEAYLAGPLRRQLKQAGFRMQVELTDYVARCAAELEATVREACPGATAVRSKASVEVLLDGEYRAMVGTAAAADGHDDDDDGHAAAAAAGSASPIALNAARRRNELANLARAPPMFTVRLKVQAAAKAPEEDEAAAAAGADDVTAGTSANGGGLATVVSEVAPGLFVEGVDRMLEVLGNLAGIHQVEKLVMRGLKWTDDPLLSPLAQSAEAVAATRVACRDMLEAESGYLAEYVALCAVYDKVAKPRPRGEEGAGGGGGAVAHSGSIRAQLTAAVVEFSLASFY